MDDSWNPYAEQKNPDTKDHILYRSYYMKFWNRTKNDRKWVIGCPGWGEEGNDCKRAQGNFLGLWKYSVSWLQWQLYDCGYLLKLIKLYLNRVHFTICKLCLKTDSKELKWMSLEANLRVIEHCFYILLYSYFCRQEWHWFKKFLSRGTPG